MIDAFALLQLPRLPWLEAEIVRDRFQEFARDLHPDRGGTGVDFAELTRAYEILREPTSRLRHWLALEAPEATIPASVPPDLMSWFAPVSSQVRGLKEAAARKAAATSAIARAMAVANTAQAEVLLSDLQALREEFLARIRGLQTLASESAPELAAIAGKLAFFDKWIAQLREGLLLNKM